MKEGAHRRSVFRGIVGLSVFFLWLHFLYAGQAASGNIIGFLYDQDGTSPVSGAVVKFKNLTTGAVHESNPSDSNGIFTLSGVESGVYTYGVVSTERGDFNAEGVVGIQVSENQTAKLSIALKPYDKEEAAAVKDMNLDKESHGEFMVGIVADFDDGAQTARVEVVKGVIRVHDKIHARGRATDFYQDVAALRVQDTLARQVLAGQTVSIPLEHRAEKGDRVFVVQDKKVFPFFLAPAGVAAVIAGNMAVTHGVLRITDKGEPVSAYKNK
jgi:hypothetical protein